MTTPRIGISLGDPGGIGPEVTLKALSYVYPYLKAEFIVFGSKRIIEEEYKLLGGNINSSGITIHEVEPLMENFKRGCSQKEHGIASFRYFEQAVKEAQKRNLQAVVTAPISKHSWYLAGIPWAGHTAYLTHLYPDATMAFFSNKLNVVLFTHHVSLREAIRKIKRKPLQKFFLRLHKNFCDLVKREHQFLVSGLNPHAGEKGLLGSEEKKEIEPAVAFAREKGVPINGPFPPDTVFKEACNHPDKIVISLYHDQGLIAFKMVAFDEGVNVTLGLPFIRTSPDHGTAFDISEQKSANPKSMIEAIKLAYKLSGSDR